ncbi:MAG: beta-ketoacyl-[Muribaculaceae bacterium]|nr:beta-ketoacyl-[acyl-carrier-protein] synthase family protein [Muribaculaceae bacterium]
MAQEGRLYDGGIAITGEGIVSAIGNSKLEVLQSLEGGITGIGEMKHLGSSHHELPVGEVKLSNNEMKSLLGIDESQEVSRTALMAMLALRQAIDESGVAELKRQNPSLRVVLVSGTTVGGMDITEQHFATLSQSDEHIACLLQHDCGSSTEYVSHHFGIFDDCTTISTACSSAANALILAANMLKAGEADVVVAGGTESLSLFHLNGFNSLMILDHEVCRPFDDTRAGLNLGEGAAYVVMERTTDAASRNAHVEAYLTGYGNACDAFHQTASSDDGEGAFLAMREALIMAQIEPNDINYINAHGTGTPNNDLSESMAIKRVFSDTIPPVTSTKMYTGHTTSASGSIEAVICLLAMNNSFVPSNLGFAHAIPGGVVPSMGIKNHKIDHVMCNSFGFGGNDTSLIFSRDEVKNPEPMSLLSDDDIRIVAQVEITDESQLTDIRKYVSPIEARRMGKVLKSSLLSSMQALEQAGIDVPDAIITATALGCLDNSERLLVQMNEEGEALLKPTYLMQSTHNTIGSNIAIRTHCHGYNVTYTHGRDSLRWALYDAKLLLKSGKCKNVLVGLHDETTALYRDVMNRLGVKDIPTLYSKAIILSCGE